jgi:hypothetical protein
MYLDLLLRYKWTSKSITIIELFYFIVIPFIVLDIFSY